MMHTTTNTKNYFSYTKSIRKKNSTPNQVNFHDQFAYYIEKTQDEIFRNPQIGRSVTMKAYTRT